MWTFNWILFVRNQTYVADFAHRERRSWCLSPASGDTLPAKATHKRLSFPTGRVNTWPTAWHSTPRNSGAGPYREDLLQRNMEPRDCIRRQERQLQDKRQSSVPVTYSPAFRTTVRSCVLFQFPRHQTGVVARHQTGVVATAFLVQQEAVELDHLEK